MKKNKLTAILVIVIAFSAVGILNCDQAFAQSVNDWLPDTDLPTITFARFLAEVINYLATIIAIACVLVIVIGGFLWATAGADERRTSDARRWVINAVIGLIITLSAWAIIYEVLDRLL